MKKHWNYIRLFLLFAFLIMMMSFANHRHAQKTINAIEIEVFPFEDLFVTESEIQSLIFPDSINDIQLSSLRLNDLEFQLITHDLIKDAQVFYDINGQLGVEVKQRRPVLRFLDGGFQYLDEAGKIMPLSTNYSARVPIAMGFKSEEIETIFPLVKAVEKDDFLRQHVVGFNKDKEGLILSFREADFQVLFGEINQIDLKLNNFKAFYQKAKKDGKLATYKKVDLRFGNQVVCTKI